MGGSCPGSSVLSRGRTNPVDSEQRTFYIRQPMASEKRENVIGIRMTDAEASMLRDLATADGLTVADVVRLLVRREHAARFPTPTKKRK